MERKTFGNCKYQIYNGNNTGRGLDRTAKAFKKEPLEELDRTDGTEP